MRIKIQKELIFFIVLLLSGIYCLFHGLCLLHKEKNALPLETLHKEDCTAGQFVTGNINSYIGKIISNSKDGYFSGASGTYLTFGKEYEFYTIPIKDNYYIRIMISDKNMIESLENFSYGKGNDIYFEGKIIKSPDELTYEWYEDVAEFKTAGKDVIISEYVIIETDIKKLEKIIYPGIFFLILSLVQFYFMGGLSRFVVAENPDNEQS